MIATVPLPLSSKACVQVGLSTTMGTGAAAVSSPHLAVVRTTRVVLAEISAEKYTGTWSATSTRMKAVGTP